MSKSLYYERLSAFKEEVLKRLVYWNVIGFFILFIAEGIILYELAQILAPFTVLYNHVWTIGILTCVVIFVLFCLNVLLIEGLVTAQGRIKYDFRYDIDRYFVMFVKMAVSFVAMGASYSAVEYITTAFLTIIDFEEVMNVLLISMLLGGAVVAIMLVAIHAVVNVRRDENWWCDEMVVLFKKKTADDAAKALIKENKGVIKGQYER